MDVSTTLHGIVRGRTIELTGHPELRDGTEVQVVIRPEQLPQPWGEVLRRCAGPLADDWSPADDRLVAEIR